MVSMEAFCNYSSTTSITSRPLYFPHCGQTRCGSFGEWQLGHSPMTLRFNASCVRRADVRRLECLRFGFGIVLSLLFQLLQSLPAIVDFLRRTLALLLIQVLPALRTNPLASLAAQPLHGQRKQHILPKDVV